MKTTKRLTYHQAKLLKTASQPDQVWIAFKTPTSKTVFSHNGNVIRSLVNEKLLLVDYHIYKQGLNFIYYTSIQGSL